MNGDDPESAKIARDAADWFAKLRGDVTDEDRAAFERWRAADPRHGEHYDRLLRRWDQSAFLANSDLARSRDLDRAATWSRQSNKRRWIAGSVAAAIALAVLTPLGLQRLSPPDAAPQAVAFINSETTVRTIRLADGSSVLLDAGAALTVQFLATERRLRLARGRVRFTVAHDPARPFVVDADGGSIIAHGTIFDVALTDGLVSVTLLRGSVEVRTGIRAPGSASRFLRPGQRTTFGAGRALAAPSEVKGADAAWPSGMVTFDHTSLGEAAAAFNRRSPAALEVIGEAQALRISGAFRADDPAGFADAAAAMFDLVVERRGTTIMLKARKKP